MKTTESGETLDALFHQAVSAIDAGDVTALEHLLAAHSELVRERLDSPGAWLRDKVGNALDGFFQRPYLLWFVAEDPVRNGKLPRNIAQIARVIIQAAQRGGVNSLREQLNYALRLVCWSWIARECGVQIQLIDVLTGAGASVDGTHSDAAIYNGNFAAAAHLLERGAPLTLSTALCLGRWADVERLARTSSLGEKQDAFVLAALKGQAEALRRMLALGVDPTTVSAQTQSHGIARHSPASRRVVSLAGGSQGAGRGRRRSEPARHNLRRDSVGVGYACRTGGEGGVAGETVRGDRRVPS